MVKGFVTAGPDQTGHLTVDDSNTDDGAFQWC